MIVASVGAASAESILFPYVVYNTSAGLDTMVTVISTASTNSPFLHYRYWMKNATATNANVNACTEDNFTRPTTANDIVTFAPGGSSILNSGNAMFNDATNYNAGVGAPSFMPLFASPAVGYLTVTPSNSAGVDVVAQNINTLLMLDGEASVYDITSGAMWGYRAVPSANGTNSGFSAQGSALLLADAVPANVTTIPAPRVSFYPHSNFTSRFFVTPARDNMLTSDGGAIGTTIGLLSTDSILGVWDRNEAQRSGGTVQSVRCVGRVDAATMSSALTNAAALLNQGGWSYVGIGTGPAFIYELKYGTLGAGMINDQKPVVGNPHR